MHVCVKYILQLFTIPEAAQNGLEALLCLCLNGIMVSSLLICTHICIHTISHVPRLWRVMIITTCCTGLHLCTEWAWFKSISSRNLICSIVVIILTLSCRQMDSVCGNEHQSFDSFWALIWIVWPLQVHGQLINCPCILAAPLVRQMPANSDDSSGIVSLCLLSGQRGCVHEPKLKLN